MLVTKELASQLHDKDLRSLVVRRDTEGTTSLELTFEGTFKGNSVSSTLSYLSDSRLHVYTIYTNSGWDYQINRKAACFISLSNYESDRELGTALNSVKVGDDIHFEFVANNNNGSINAARLHRDQCSLAITRGNKRLQFLLEVNVAPDNANRMIDEIGAGYGRTINAENLLRTV